VFVLPLEGEGEGGGENFLKFHFQNRKKRNNALLFIIYGGELCLILSQ